MIDNFNDIVSLLTSQPVGEDGKKRIVGSFQLKDGNNYAIELYTAGNNTLEGDALMCEDVSEFGIFCNTENLEKQTEVQTLPCATTEVETQYVTDRCDDMFGILAEEIGWSFEGSGCKNRVYCKVQNLTFRYTGKIVP